MTLYQIRMYLCDVADTGGKVRGLTTAEMKDLKHRRQEKGAMGSGDGS